VSFALDVRPTREYGVDYAVLALSLKASLGLERVIRRVARAGGAGSKSPERLQAFSFFCQGFSWNLQTFPWNLQAFLWWFRGVSKGCKGKKEKKPFAKFFEGLLARKQASVRKLPERVREMGKRVRHGE
jgi:hypothetical protein